jgi:glutamyl-Q tRNA(Asp) synthetase
LLRIEDTDPLRTSAGAADEMLRTLDALALHWDGSVLYQSARFAVYEELAQNLLAGGRAFRCSCTRASLRRPENKGPLGYRYPGTCRRGAVHGRPAGIRVQVEPGVERFVDRLQGECVSNLAASSGDYLIMRSDALPAYHLAVVADDAEQGVTDVVRGCDLLEATAVHRHLQRTLDLPVPRYAHLPVVTNRTGQKLSKQTGAAPADRSNPAGLALLVLRQLGVDVAPDLEGAPPANLWRWAAEHWTIESLRGLSRLTLRSGTPAEPQDS